MTFFDKYSYKIKNRALLVLIVLLIAVAYKRVFSITLDARTYRFELSEKLEKAKSADTEIRRKQVELAQMNRYLGEENNTVEKVQQGFLNFFARNAESLGVYQIDEVLNYKHPDFEINTHNIILKGDYLSTLGFLYKLEKEFTLAKILNIQFEYKRMSNDESEALYTSILIQNYVR